MNDDLSRRKLLLAVATTGAAASTGTGVAALMQDAERTQSEVTAGTLDLTADPSWGNSESTDGTATGSISGSEGRETVMLTVTNNPSYVWFRTQCQQCTEDETRLQVRFGLDTDGDGDVDLWLDGFDGTEDGYLSLREARLQLGEGVQLDGQFHPDDIWNLVVEWTTDEMVMEELNVTFDFDFYAVQVRHAGNSSSVAPTWECPEDCTTTSTEPSLSYVAFCASSDIAPDDVSFTLTGDGSTITLDTVPDSVGAVLLKRGTTLEVYEDESIAAGDSFTFGDAADANTHQQERDRYPTTGTEPPRSNSNPCPESDWLKYEFSEDRWTSDSDGGDA